MKKVRFFKISNHNSSVDASIKFILVFLLFNLNYVKSDHFVNHLIKSPIECFCFGSNTTSSTANCVSKNYGVRVITSDFQLDTLNQKELNWLLINLTSVVINRNVYKLVHDFTNQLSSNLNQHQILINPQVTTIDLSNDLNEYIQPLHLKNYLSFSDDELFNENLYYWQAPEQYVGNKLYSYGNELQFKLAYSVLRGDVASNKCNYEQDADVLIGGLIENRIYFIGYKWTRYQNKFKCDIPITIRIKLKEHNWFKLDPKLKLINQTVDRSQFSLILNSLRVLLIRASYHSDQIEARLYTVTLGVTDPELKIDSPFLAKSTAICVNCSGNRDGLFCEKCKKGYYGNPLTDYYCKPCQCPGIPNYSYNYHAEGCFLDPNLSSRPICQCKKGYSGERCDHCDLNYYLSDPIKGECKKCDCNGNVDFREPDVCNPVTGKCKNCLFNTQGDHCQVCKPGYFGDALKQSCRPCASCNSSNIIDLKSICEHKHHHNHSLLHHCNKCPSGYYKKFIQIMDKHQRMQQHFTCEPCNCSPHGSLNNGECTSSNGKCYCKPAFTGLKCSECAFDRGYEKYGFDCISCKSNQTNSCINALRYDIQLLQDKSSDYSFDTLKTLPVIKLNNFKEQLAKQSEKIDYIIDYEQRVYQVINNVSESIPGLSAQLEMDLDVANLLLNRTENTSQKAIEVKKDGDLIFNRLRYYYSELLNIINVVNATRKVKLNNNQCDHILEQSHSMVTEIKLVGHELSEFHKVVEEHKIESDNLLQSVKNFLNESSIIPLDSELIDRMLRLTNISFDSFEIYEKQFSRPYLQTLEIIGRSNQLYEQIQELFANASASIQEMNNKLNESFSKLELAKQNLTVLSSLYDAFPNEFNNLKTHTIEKLKNTLIRLNPQNEEKYAQIAKNHANELSNKAEQLKAKFNSTLSFASKYENQTNNSRYNQIIDTIRIVQDDVNEIEEKLQELFSQIYSEKESDEKAENRKEKSMQLAKQAEELKNIRLEEIQQRLDQRKQDIESIQNRTFTIDEINSNLKSRNTLLLDIEDGLKELTNRSHMFKGIGELFPNTNEIINAYNDKINKFNSTIIQDYLPRINNLKSRKLSLDGDFVGEIDKIQTNIENKSKYVRSFEVRNNKMDHMHRIMHRNLNEIITKIRLARQKASTIRISIRNRPFIDTRNVTSNLDNLKSLSLLKRNNNLLMQQQLVSNVTTLSSLLNTQQTTTNNQRFSPTLIQQQSKIQQSLANLPPSQLATNEIYQQPVIINCKRSYESELEASSVNTISLTITVNEQDKPDSLFLYVGSKFVENNDKYNDFYVVEMVNRRIRFIWNTGNGVQILEHPMKIEFNNLNLSNRDKWYRVQVLRLATVTHLQVHPLSNANQVQELSRTFFSNESLDLFNGLEQNKTIFTADDNIIRTKSIGNSIRMDFDKSTEILVGALPDHWIERTKNLKNSDLNYLSIPNQIKSRNMSGCLFELILDGHNINLFNFQTTTPACIGCREGVTEERPSNIFRFKGKFSYAMLPQINRYNNLKYLIQLNIRTFEENALLFFTCNPITGDHIILSLIEGRIRFQVVSKNSIGQIIGIDLMSKEKYNSGQWVNIAAEREQLEGLLKIDVFNELLEDTIHILPYKVTDNYLYPFNLDQQTSSASLATNLMYSRQLKLDLSDQYLFIGGIPLNFSSNQCSSKLQTINSFNGCMKDVQVDTTPLNLLNQICYGVDNDCFDQLSSRSISFNADAYMEFNGQPLGTQSEFSFAFKTLQSNALILLSMFNKRDFQDHFESFYLHNHYRILIKNGFIVLKIKAISETDRTLVSKIILLSKNQINDNQFHTLSVIKEQRKISLYIDDEECGTLRLARKVHNVQAPSNGGLYIGGIPTNFQPTEELEIKNAFNGTIKEIVFNRKLMDLNRKFFLNSTF